MTDTKPTDPTAAAGHAIAVTVEDPVCIIRLDRPERLNARPWPCPRPAVDRPTDQR